AQADSGAPLRRNVFWRLHSALCRGAVVSWKKAVIAILLGCVPLAASAGSWWNGDWQYRKEIGFDLSPTGADVAGTAEFVPVLVRLSLANFSYFNDTKP